MLVEKCSKGTIQNSVLKYFELNSIDNFLDPPSHHQGSRPRRHFETPGCSGAHHKYNIEHQPRCQTRIIGR